MQGLDGFPVFMPSEPSATANHRACSLSVGIPLEVSFAQANQSLRRNLLILGRGGCCFWMAAQSCARRFFVRRECARRGRRSLAEAI